LKTAPLIEFIQAQSDFPGRVAGSEAERTCQAAYAGRMDRLGLDAVVEGAVCPPPLPNILLLHAGVFLGALLLSLVKPWAGMLLSFVATLSFYGELRGRPRILRWFLLKRISGNMVARLRNPEAKGRVLVVAHADVASASALFHPWVKRWTTHREQPGRTLHPGTLVLVAGVAQTIAAAEQGSRSDISAFALTLLLGAAFVHVVLLVLALDWWRSPPTEGAIDNASGLAVAWGLAKQIARDPLPHTELWVVATGDREPEGGGMRAFLSQFGRHLDPDTTFVVNIDEVGLGKLHIITAEGRWRRTPYRPTLPGLAERVATRPEFAGIKEAELVGTTDAGVATEIGLRAVTLTSLIDGERPMLLHTHDDVAAAVDPESLDEALRFALALVRVIDEHLSGS